MNGNISIFSLEDIRNRKQLVLTTLKACIIEGGEISIQLFLKISRILPPNIVYPNHAHILCTELSTSYIQIHRRYHLTFIDSTSLSPSISQTTTPTPPTMRNTSSYMTIFQSLPLSENILIRCFSPLPIDSLMRGLFQSIEDAERYRLICLRYSRALERNRLPMEKKSYFLESLWGINQKQDDSYYLQREELVMEGILTHYSQQALQSFENGNFVQAGRWLLSLQTILISSKDGNLPLHENRSRSKRGKISTSTSSVSLYDHSSHCMKQIAALSGQAIGKLNSIKNMIDSYLTCIQLYLTEYMETNPFFNHITEPTHHPQGGNNKSSTIENGLEAVLSQYETISLSLIEIKSILYGLYRDRDAYNSSVILLMIQEFIDIIDTFFQEDQTNQTILPTRQKLQQLPITSIPLEIIKSLRSLIDPLHQISLSLQFLCSSLGGDILLELLQMDYDVKYEYDLPSLTGAVKRTNNLSFDTQNERSIFTVPLLFSELLGNQPPTFLFSYSCYL